MSDNCYYCGHPYEDHELADDGTKPCWHGLGNGNRCTCQQYEPPVVEIVKVESKPKETRVIMDSACKRQAIQLASDILLSSSSDITKIMRSNALAVYTKLLVSSDPISDNLFDQTGHYIQPDVINEIQFLISGKRKIQAIKLLRQETGMGLKDAKDAVENGAIFSQPIAEEV